MRTSLAIALAALAGASGCLNSQLQTCSDGSVCPDGSGCDPRGGPCIGDEFFEACDGKRDGESCDFGGASGTCDRKVCDVAYAAFCGDDAIDLALGEICDGDDLLDTCISLGYGRGRLRCDNECKGYDTSGCQELGWRALRESVDSMAATDTGLWIVYDDEGVEYLESQVSISYPPLPGALSNQWALWSPGPETAVVGVKVSESVDGVYFLRDGAWTRGADAIDFADVAAIHGLGTSEVVAVGEADRVHRWSETTDQWSIVESGEFGGNLVSAYQPSDSASTVYVGAPGCSLFTITDDAAPSAVDVPASNGAMFVVGTGSDVAWTFCKLSTNTNIGYFNGQVWAELNGALEINAYALEALDDDETFIGGFTGSPTNLQLVNRSGNVLGFEIPLGANGIMRLQRVGDDLYARNEYSVLYRLSGGGWQQPHAGHGSTTGVTALATGVSFAVGDGTARRCDTNASIAPCASMAGVPAESLTDVWSAGDGTAFAVGHTGYAVRFDENLEPPSWLPLTTDASADLLALDGYVAADSVAQFIAVGASGAALQWTGGEFASLDLGTSVDLLAVAASAELSVIAGSDGFVAVITSAGIMTDNIEGAGRLHAAAVFGDTAFVAGEGGAVYHYQDGAWTPQRSGVPFDIHALAGTSSADVFAAGGGGTLLRWDGEDWNPIASPTLGTIRDLTMDGRHVIMLAGDELYRLHRVTDWTAP